MKAWITKTGRRAFTLIELMVVMVCVALLVAVVLPMLRNARQKARGACCNCNLKQIGLAFRTWSTDNGERYPMLALTNRDGSRQLDAGTNVFLAFQVMSNELNNPVILVCPEDKRSAVADFSKLANTNLSYFIGLDADETMPAMLLTGDRNVTTNGVAAGPGLLTWTPGVVAGFSQTMHRGKGNVGLSDGSVQQGTSANFQTLLSRTGTNVNRLAIP